MRIPQTVLTFISIVSMAASGSGTVLKRMTLEDLANAASAIAHVRCITSESKWQNGEIWTFTTFGVQQVWKGDLPPQIVARLPGGRTASLTSIVPGVPRFQTGEEAVLFLEPMRSGEYSITSWEAGTFRIRRARANTEALVSQDTAEYESHPPYFAIRGISLSTFRQFVNMALDGAPKR